MTEIWEGAQKLNSARYSIFSFTYSEIPHHTEINVCSNFWFTWTLTKADTEHLHGCSTIPMWGHVCLSMLSLVSVNAAFTHVVLWNHFRLYRIAAVCAFGVKSNLFTFLAGQPVHLKFFCIVLKAKWGDGEDGVESTVSPGGSVHHQHPPALDSQTRWPAGRAY